jgi:hypothetical protein
MMVVLVDAMGSFKPISYGPAWHLIDEIGFILAMIECFR